MKRCGVFVWLDDFPVAKCKRQPMDFNLSSTTNRLLTTAGSDFSPSDVYSQMSVPRNKKQYEVKIFTHMKVQIKKQ